MACTLVLGGARSGKSTFAEELAGRLGEVHSLPVTYLATGQALDDEMDERIERHRAQRPRTFRTVEEPLEAAGWIRSQTEPQVILLDCLSLLLSNWMFIAHAAEDEFFTRRTELMSAIAESSNPIVMVSNEVGQGIVPGDALSRTYRDWLGWLNQAAAKHAESVIWVVAGIPVDLKKFQVSLP